jgi:hypothetical protein
MPLQVEILYNEYDFVGAFAVASLLTLLAVATLIVKKLIEHRGHTRGGEDEGRRREADQAFHPQGHAGGVRGQLRGALRRGDHPARPSGSGKTTILRIVAGLESADEGRGAAGGPGHHPVPVGKRRFGFVFQTFALFNHLTVRENIAFGLEAQGVKGDPGAQARGRAA